MDLSNPFLIFHCSFYILHSLRSGIFAAMQPLSLLTSKAFGLTVGRLCYQLIEDHGDMTDLEFSLDERKVVIVDDVLYTGRTIRAGLDAMLAFGRPASVQLLVLVDRRFSRELPIQPDYVGKWVDSIDGQRVNVEWQESDGKDQVLLLNDR